MTSVQYWLFSGHYFLLTRIWNQHGPEPEPVVALMDTEATKCSIPKSMNDNRFHFPIVGHDDNVITASNAQGYDAVRIPLLNLVRIVSLGPNNYSLEETDLQEANVEAWLGSRYTLGMNWILKFNMSLTLDGRIVIER